MSQQLPSIFADLFEHPTRTVGLTHHNHTVFRLDVAASAYYYAFFDIRRPSMDAQFNLFVQSAYVRPAIVRTRRKLPFGKCFEHVAERAGQHSP